MMFGGETYKVWWLFGCFKFHKMIFFGWVNTQHLGKPSTKRSVWPIWPIWPTNLYISDEKFIWPAFKVKGLRCFYTSRKIHLFNRKFLSITIGLMTYKNAPWYRMEFSCAFDNLRRPEVWNILGDATNATTTNQGFLVGWFLVRGPSLAWEACGKPHRWQSASTNDGQGKSEERKTRSENRREVAVFRCFSHVSVTRIITAWCDSVSF